MHLFVHSRGCTHPGCVRINPAEQSLGDKSVLFSFSCLETQSWILTFSFTYLFSKHPLSQANNSLLCSVLILIFRSSASARRGGQTKQRPEAKMPLQTIHMTTENQRRVKELLRELQGQDLAPESELV